MKTKRRHLSAEEEADAQRLRDLWTKKSSSLRLTQLKASKEFGYANQSAVSQYLNARIPLNLETAAKFAKILHVGIDEISPRFAKALLPASVSDCPLIAAIPTGRVLEADKAIVAVIGECKWVVADEHVKQLSEGVFVISSGDQQRKVVRIEKVDDSLRVHGIAAKPVTIPMEAAALITVHAQILYKISRV